MRIQSPCYLCIKGTLPTSTPLLLPCVSPGRSERIGPFQRQEGAQLSSCHFSLPYWMGFTPCNLQNLPVQFNKTHKCIAILGLSQRVPRFLSHHSHPGHTTLVVGLQGWWKARLWHRPVLSNPGSSTCGCESWSTSLNLLVLCLLICKVGIRIPLASQAYLEDSEMEYQIRTQLHATLHLRVSWPCFSPEFYRSISLLT